MIADLSKEMYWDEVGAAMSYYEARLSQYNMEGLGFPGDIREVEKKYTKDRNQILYDGKLEDMPDEVKGLIKKLAPEALEQQ